MNCHTVGYVFVTHISKYVLHNQFIKDLFLEALVYFSVDTVIAVSLIASPKSHQMDNLKFGLGVID